MKRWTLLAAFLLCFGNAALAAVIDLTPIAAGANVAPTAAQRPLPVLAVTNRNGIVIAAPRLSELPELPEPEVFAMMLVGLILIGYRARRDKSDKFK